MIAENVPSRVGRLRTVGRRFSRYTFAPAYNSVHSDLGQYNSTDGRGLHAGLERSYQVHVEFAQCQLFDTHKWLRSRSMGRYGTHWCRRPLRLRSQRSLSRSRHGSVHESTPGWLVRAASRCTPSLRLKMEFRW